MGKTKFDPVLLVDKFNYPFLAANSDFITDISAPRSATVYYIIYGSNLAGSLSCVLKRGSDSFSFTVATLTAGAIGSVRVPISPSESVNFRFSVQGDIALSYCRAYNSNTTAWTNEDTDVNNSTANDVLLPPIQSTTAGDAIYFVHSSNKFAMVKVNVGTAGVYSGLTLQWQYYNGVSWAALSNVTDGTNGFKTSGSNTVTFDVPSDWATVTVNSITGYAVRCTVTARASPVLTTPPLATQAWLGGSFNLFRVLQLDYATG